MLSAPVPEQVAPISLEGFVLETVESFKYLGFFITDPKSIAKDSSASSVIVVPTAPVAHHSDVDVYWMSYLRDCVPMRTTTELPPRFCSYANYDGADKRSIDKGKKTLVLGRKSQILDNHNS